MTLEVCGPTPSALGQKAIVPLAVFRMSRVAPQRSHFIVYPPGVVTQSIVGIPTLLSLYQGLVFVKQFHIKVHRFNTYLSFPF
jgi:hypothetical protein